MLDTTTGEVVSMTLKHEGKNVREFYSKLPRPVRVGIEATGSMQWFVNLMEELGIECLVGHPAEIRAAEPRKQKHDRRDADLILKLLVENRFPAIWLPSKELQDLRSLLRHRHQWCPCFISPNASWRASREPPRFGCSVKAYKFACSVGRKFSCWTKARI
jgi:transposase